MSRIFTYQYTKLLGYNIFVHFLEELRTRYLAFGNFFNLISDHTYIKVYIFWEGHKILRNIHQLFKWPYIGQIIGGDFANFCGFLRIYEL